MCGIVGYIGFKNNINLSEMLNTISHRGPDEEGLFEDRANYVGLGHKRLSIIDVDLGKQPIYNEDNTIAIVFNGEIYNHKELRKSLLNRGHLFKTNTDTETIVHLYEDIGLECLKLLRGMFAFAIWDKTKKRLLLARDRIGIKPLFYLDKNGKLLFASEIKAILKNNYTNTEINFNALHNYLTYMCVPAPETIFKGINQLMPGCYLIYEKGKISVSEYWDLNCNLNNKNIYEEKYLMKKLYDLLEETIRLEMISDVPIGAFLSGGVDSSTIVALMSNFSTKPIKTFSIGFEDEYYNELPNAKLVSERFGTEHFEFIVEPISMDFIEKMLNYFDQPFADSSAIPTYMLSQFASKKVKVVLSGDGGDELFAGYGNYKADKIYLWLRQAPEFIYKKIVPYLAKRDCIDNSSNLKIQLLKKIMRMASLSPEYAHIGWLNVFSEEAKRELYDTNNLKLLLNRNSNDKYYALFKKYDIDDFINLCTCVDIKTILLNDYLVKVDMMSMANSIEVRVPFLDHKLLEFVVSLPSKYKLRRISSKYLLKKVMKNKLPKNIIEGKKKGFSIPLSKWFNTGFKPLINEYLSEQCINKRGYFNAKYIKTISKEHMEGKDNSKLLWTLICFEIWNRNYKNVI